MADQRDGTDRIVVGVDGSDSEQSWDERAARTLRAHLDGGGERLDTPFAEADDLHPPADIAKMSAGCPLDDADRQPGWSPSAADRGKAKRRAPAACWPVRR